MGTNGNGQFLESELIHRKVKVGNDWQTKTFPVVGGRLRILHENNDNLIIQTEIVRLENDFAVIKAVVESHKGKFNGTGTSSIQRDAKLADSLVELAETRAIARALRFGGIGVEYTGAEEVSHVAAPEPEREQTTGKKGKPVLPERNQDSKAEAKFDGNGNGKAVAPNGTAVSEGPKPSNGSNGRATGAQVRALFALSRRANYQDEDVAKMLTHFEVSRFEDLSREAASHLISRLQSQVA